MRIPAVRLALGLVMSSAVPALFAQAAAGTAWMRQGPTINGNVEGSLQQMTGESATLNGGAAITGDLLVPGTPTLKINGSAATFGGTLAGTGSTTPTGYTITLNGNSRLGHLRTRTDPIAFPTVAAPPSPAGTRSVSLNNSSQSPGDFATLKNLTLNSNVGSVTVPAGVYGDFTANSGSSFTIGVAGATTAAVYAFQRLTLNSNSQLNVVGPVLITVANSVSINGSLAGAAAHPEWLALQFSSGGLTLNSNVSMYGYVLAPNGTVTINGQSLLAGGLTADRLTVNGNGTLRVLAPAANQPPAVSLTSPTNNSQFIAPAAFTLAASASDADGTIAKVEFYQGTTKLGEDLTAPYQLALTGLAAATYTFKARAIDNSNAATDSAAVTVVVGVNQPPTVSLTSPASGATLVAPASVTLAAAASDADGTIAKVEFYQGNTKLGEDIAAPYQFSVPALAVGSYTFSVRAFDNGNATTDSAVVTISVVSPPNQLPSVTLTSPVGGASFFAPATINLNATASDPDGTITQVEFFQGATNLGATTVSPYMFSVSGVAAGSYVFKARATDNFGATADSAAVSVSVVGVNQSPTVALTSPASGTTYNAPATIPLAASASDPDGSVAKVEFFQGATKLGESLVAPFAFTWTGMLPGSYALSAKATDNQGATAQSSASAVTVQATVPFAANFNDTEGYVLGPLNGQGGWVVLGSADYSAADHFSGTRCVVIAATTPATEVAHSFPNGIGQSFVFIDFYAKLAAGANPAVASRVQGDGASVALIQSGSQAEIQIFNGNGAGSGAWQPTGFKVNVAANGQTVDWLRLTLREDYAAMKWDLYANGRLIAANVGFLDNSATAFSKVTFTGSTATPVLLDDFFVAFDKPLFADADKDGMDDAWEVSNGLNPALNDRMTDKDGDGLTSIREYLLGLRADKAATYDDGIPDGLRVSLGLSLTGPTVDTTLPAAPTNLVATVAALNVTLSWTASTDNIGVAGYFISRGGQQLNAVAINATTFSDTVPSAGASYSYEVKAVDFAANRSLPASVQVNIPLPDTDGDGLPDPWEIAHFGHIGASPTADADGDGLTNLQEYQRGTNPNSADTDGDGVPDGTEVGLGLNPLVADANSLPTKLPGLRLLLQAGVGVTADAGGKVSVWQDQSSLANHATQTDAGRAPVLVANSMNGRPAVHFETDSDFLRLPNLMNGATAGEIFAVVKLFGPQTGGVSRTFWTLGTGSNTYTDSNGGITENFGTTSYLPGPLPAAALSQPHLYNVSAKSGSWQSAINGLPYVTAYSNTVSFSNASPTLGWSGNTIYGRSLWGDIAEIIVFDRALSTSERETVGAYLNQKYALQPAAATAPSSLTAAAISTMQVSLAWQGPLLASGVVYEVERQTGSSGFALLAEVGNAFSYIDGTAVPGTAYSYRVRARNLIGRSAYGNTATVATPSFGAPAMPTSGLRLWLKADAVVTNSRVSTWPDQSPSHHDALQFNTASAPYVVANAMNGRPVVRFDTDSTFLRLPDVMSGATEGEIFAVLTVNNPAGGIGRTLWSMGSGSNAYTDGSGRISENFGASSGLSGPVATQALAQPHLYNVSAKSGAWKSLLNGATYVSSTSTPVSFSNASPTLGWSGNVVYNRSFSGDIAEIVLFDHVLSDAERGAVAGYLGTKYGLVVTPPGTPDNLAASVTNGAQVTLTWAAGPGPTTGTTYTIERAVDGGSFVYVASVTGALKYVDSDVLPNTAYSYRVAAFNSVGSAGYGSATSVVTPDTLIPISVWADDADSDGIRDLEETILGSNPAVPAAADVNGSLKLRIYVPR